MKERALVHGLLGGRATHRSVGMNTDRHFLDVTDWEVLSTLGGNKSVLKHPGDLIADLDGKSMPQNRQTYPSFDFL